MAVRNDLEAEQLVHALQGCGYAVVALVEQTHAKRLATARLRKVRGPGADVIVDLLFASSGIEPEIVKQATRVRLLPGLEMKVARVGHLIATKVLARDDRARPQDWDDLRALLAVADSEERAMALASLKLIEVRGFHRERSLISIWKKTLREFAP